MRYSRQIKFFENSCDYSNSKFIQDSFNNKHIIIIGCGGVGSVIGQNLVRGGFLNITLVDNDLIDETNIQRQQYFESDIGKSKSKTLSKYLKKINKKINIKFIENLIDETNISKYCSNSDLIIDATDNFETRLIINKFCEKEKKDWIYIGAISAECCCILFKGEKKLFSKVFNNKNMINKSCCEIGVLSSTTQCSVSLAYNEILKYFLDKKNYESKLIKFNMWNLKLFIIKI